MKIIKGSSASSGIAIGTVCLYEAEQEETVPHYLIGNDQVDREVERAAEAVKHATETIDEVIRHSREEPENQASEIFGAHRTILNDRSIFRKIESLIRTRLINAEHAVSDVFESYIDRYRGGKGHFGELIHDLMDIRNSLLAAFGGDKGHFACPVPERQQVVIATKTMLPSMFHAVQRENLLAIISEEGGYTTHATILARSYGVPVVFGIPFAGNFACGDGVIVDGSSGRVIVGPDNKTRETYAKKLETIKKRKNICDMRKQKPSATGEGAGVSLKVNLSVPFEMTMLKDVYYDGIGLLRTEFLFQGKEPPSEEVQYQTYRTILEDAGHREVTVRLLDIGSDKLPSYIELPHQQNPDLGIRGARAVEYFKDIYLTQARALCRAGIYGNLKILFPMVSDLSDLEIYRDLLAKVRRQLSIRKKPFQTGVMIETPSSALLSDRFLEEVDFVNIGSNDLLQYTLAAARGNSFAEKRYHIVHPALLKLFEIIIAAGKKHGKEVCLCGEIASFEEFYPIFLNMGLTTFSVPVAKYEEIKCAVSFKRTGKKGLLQQVYRTRSKKELDRLFQQPVR